MKNHYNNCKKLLAIALCVPYLNLSVYFAILHIYIYICTFVVILFIHVLFIYIYLVFYFCNFFFCRSYFMFILITNDCPVKIIHFVHFYKYMLNYYLQRSPYEINKILFVKRKLATWGSKSSKYYIIVQCIQIKNIYIYIIIYT